MAWFLSALASVAKFALLGVVWLILIAILVTYSRYFFARSFGPAVIEIEKFTAFKEASADLGAQVVARAQELIEPVHLDSLFEVNVPPIRNNFGTKDAIKLPDTVKISLGSANLDLVGAVTAFLSVLPEDRYKLTAQKDETYKDKTLLLQWKPPGEAPRQWLLRVRATDGVDSSDTTVVDRILVDRAIYQILYFIYYDPEGPSEWRKSFDPKVRFTTARALESFYSGQQRLSAYFRTLEPEHLAQAERQFRNLLEEMPRLVDGLMLLGVTLSEMRKEREAIDIYERAESELAFLQADHFDARKKFFQARLFKAMANRKLYRWENLHLAVAGMDGLVDELDKTFIDPALSPQDRLEFQKIEATVRAERANTIGYYLILLYGDNFVAALTDSSLPKSLKPTPERITELKAIQDAYTSTPADKGVRTKRNQALSGEKNRLFGLQQIALQEARDDLPKITSDGSASGRTERDRIESVIFSAQGYATFRNAQVRTVSDEEFRNSCQEALQALNRADALQPHHYITLQNLGMIYGDPRFDPPGNSIETARRLFSRSVKIKPDDYFGYQYLALLAARQGHLRGLSFVKDQMGAATTAPIKPDGIIYAGIESAKHALELTPDNWVVHLVLSQLYALRAAALGKDTQGNDLGKADIELMNSSLAAAIVNHANPVRVAAARLQWELLQLVSAARPEEFAKLKQAFADKAKDAHAEADKYFGWEATKLAEDADALTQRVAQTSFDNRAQLRWPQ